MFAIFRSPGPLWYFPREQGGEKYAKLVKQQSSAHGPIHGHVYVPCRATDPDPGVVVGFGYAFFKKLGSGCGSSPQGQFNSEINTRSKILSKFNFSIKLSNFIAIHIAMIKYEK